MMKFVLVIAFLVAGCVGGVLPVEPSGESVQLLTGVPENGIADDGVSCFVDQESGQLIVDPKYGIALVSNMGTSIVSWRRGYTGRRVGSEIAVFDPRGNEVAVTGRSYKLGGGHATVAGVESYWACDGVFPLPS
jgi:hypothetical protein